jgi:signal transduction histidine kinase
MKRVRWNSVRVRLTLWNAGLLALLLAGSGIALCYRVQADLMRSVDRDLAQGAEGMAGGWARQLDKRDHPRQREDAPHFRFDYPPGPRREDTPHGRFDRLPGPLGPRPPATDVERRRDLGRPRVLTLEGKAVGPGWFARDRPWDRKTLALSAAGASRYSIVQIDGEALRVYSRPFIRNGKVLNVIQIAHPLGDLQRVNREQLNTLLTLIPLALLVAGLFGSFMTDRTLRPVRQITQAAALIGAEDLSQRLEITGPDEFGELAGTFNGMIGRLEQAFSRLESAYRSLEQAYQQQRRFTADASHELRTPLARIKASASLALSAPRTAGEYGKALRIVNEAADVMNRLVQDLLLLARADDDQLRLTPQPLAVAALLQRATAAIPAVASASLRVELPERPLTVHGHRDSLERLLTNLIENAIRHTPEGGHITLSAHEAGDEVVIAVADTGEGIPPEHLPHVCDRFYRVDAARSRAEGGAGLGLAICQSIVRAHGGKLAIESEVGRGTTVRVTLPRVDLPAAERVTASAAV